MLLLSITLNFADKFFKKKNSRQQSIIYVVFLYIWTEMSYIFSDEREGSKCSPSRSVGRGSISPGCMGPLNSHGHGSVSVAPSVSEHEITLGSEWRRGELGA